MKHFEILCECTSSTCNKKVRIETEATYREIVQNDWFVIANDCPFGPDETDERVDYPGHTPGYQLYREVL